MTNPKITDTLDHLFRNEYGKVVAILTHKFGISHLETVEDAVQDTFLKAMKVWGYKRIPDNPTAWLLRVAQNALIDGLRRGKKIDYVPDTPKNDRKIQEKETVLADEISDSQLKMIFACCHPSLSQEYQIVLSLKLIGGFSNKELADALLKKEETVAKSFTRAKKKFKDEVKMLDIPVQMGLQSRLFIVFRVIYLLFSEGYSATTGSQGLKRDICYEALRLALLLRENPYCRHPNLEALIALMCFHAARFEARLDHKQQLVTLEYQDRSQYNQHLIDIGIHHLENAGTADRLPSNYHLEAAVSYYHCMAKTFSQTDWKSILHLYDLQLRQQYSPMVALNRIVPFQMVHGPGNALKELHALEKAPSCVRNTLFYAIKSELMVDLNKVMDGIQYLKKAIEISNNTLEKNHLSLKLGKLEEQLAG